MPKIVIIGAGSGFGSRLSVDILAHPGLRNGTIALVDIDKTRNDHVAAYVRRAAAELGAGVEVVATTDRREVVVSRNPSVCPDMTGRLFGDESGGHTTGAKRLQHR